MKTKNIFKNLSVLIIMIFMFGISGCKKNLSDEIISPREDIENAPARVEIEGLYTGPKPIPFIVPGYEDSYGNGSATVSLKTSLGGELIKSATSSSQKAVARHYLNKNSKDVDINETAVDVAGGILKGGVLNYWVKNYLLSSSKWLTKFAGSSIGYANWIIYVYDIFVIGTSDDQFSTIWVREDNGDVLKLKTGEFGIGESKNFPGDWKNEYFEGGTSYIGSGAYTNMTYYIGLYDYDRGPNTFTLLAYYQADLPSLTSGEEPITIVWDMDLKQIPYHTFEVWIWRWNGSDWDLYTTLKAKSIL